MPRASSLLSPLHSPYDGAVSPLSFVETVETSPVEESRASHAVPHPSTPELRFNGNGGAKEVVPLDVRLLPLFFTATYWCGLAVLYAFMAYTAGMSASWRGPVIIWALLIPTVVFSLWRRLPAEEARLRKMSEEVVLLRSGGYYSLAEPRNSAVDAEVEGRSPRHSSSRPQPPPNSLYATVA